MDVAEKDAPFEISWAEIAKFSLWMPLVLIFIILANISADILVPAKHHIRLDLLYPHLRAEIIKACGSKPIYLDLPGDIMDIKFREMLALYLADREVKADWSNDEYLWAMPNRRKIIADGDCVIDHAFIIRHSNPEPLPNS